MQWQDVLADKGLQDLAYKIELNEKGNIEMSPATNKHGAIQSELIYIFRSNLKNGLPLTECSIATTKGVKVADVAWASNQSKVFFEIFNEAFPVIASPWNGANQDETRPRQGELHEGVFIVVPED